MTVLKLESVKDLLRNKESYVSKAVKKATPREPNRIQRYFRETVGELRKVTWPTRQEAINLTIVVLIVIFAMSAFLGVLDLVYARIFALIIGG